MQTSHVTHVGRLYKRTYVQLSSQRSVQLPHDPVKKMTTLIAAVSAACEVLTDLRLSRDESKTAAAVRELSQLLYHNPEKRWSVFQAARSRGGVSALLGILRSSESISLLADAAGCIALFVQDNSRAAHELASCDVMSTLLPLVYPRREKQATPSALDSRYPLSCQLSWLREWLPVYEMALAAIRKLTYHSPALQTTFAEKGGIRLVIELCSNSDFIASSSSFSSVARDKLVELALGKKFIARAVAAPKRSQSRITKSFPPLSSPYLDQSYPCYLLDLLTEDREWVTDSLVESQLVWPSHAQFPRETDPVWTCVSVTCVQDAGHVWCQFCLDKPKPRLDAMATALRETVSFVIRICFIILQ